MKVTGDWSTVMGRVEDQSRWMKALEIDSSMAECGKFATGISWPWGSWIRVTSGSLSEWMRSWMLRRVVSMGPSYSVDEGSPLGWRRQR